MLKQITFAVATKTTRQYKQKLKIIVLDVWQTTRRQTKIWILLGQETKTWRWQKTSKRENSLQFSLTNDPCRQQEACTTFEQMSKTAKTELTMQKERRVAHFQKSVAELAELEVKHAKAHAQMLRQVILASDWSI